ncbi:MAG: transcription-repair coupling factor [Rhodospirillaceae bacterium]|nr:transcription-repair coupling factor [Rhodospirillaceae bacterium]
MKLPDLPLERPGLVRLAGVPEGADALALGAFARRHHAAAWGAGATDILHVARDDARVARLQELIEFFAPDIEIVVFPAWDCLPYDRVSPHRDIIGRRVDALSALAAPRDQTRPRILLTTVSAFLQRVTPSAGFAGAGLALRPGHVIAPDTIARHLADTGFLRVGKVGDVGEFAVRGGIIDLFPPGQDDPVRLDFFGDQIESIRRFDPITQRTTATMTGLDLRPMGELRLDKASIERFRTRYRERFGAPATEDPLYVAISEGRSYPGMEHWLPLFLEKTATLLDHATGAAVTLDHQAPELRDARLSLIEEFYEARSAAVKIRDGTPVYRALAPDELYLTAHDWDALLADRSIVALSNFAPPEGSGWEDWGARPGREFAEARMQSLDALYAALAQRIADEAGSGRHAVITTYSEGSRDRLSKVMIEHGVTGLVPVSDWSTASSLEPGATALVVLGLERGFVDARYAFITEQDILGDRLVRQPKRRRAERFLEELSNFGAGDIVVHADHGIGRYEALETLMVGGAAHDCLRIVYDGGDKLFLPVENIDLLSRFGSDETPVQLDRLGGASWQSRKARVKARIREMAAELIKVAATRAVQDLDALPPPEGLYDEFCARFPYPETDDQIRAIDDVLTDLSAGKPMDRLICGDVGFGKTEVALRAAFVVAANGKQVAVIAPTTLLARQHFRTFSDRFAGLPIRIAQISRMVGVKETAEVKRDLRDGKIDIIIGTHALLAKDIGFRSLGLLIVDEEQHFGVAQKERLKALQEDVHVLTVTATPIPRTLQLALSGVREMSLIATPPIDRLAVRTFVMPYDPVIVREAILRERNRGGQSFYVCPRIRDIDVVADRLRKLVPEVKLVIAHGQMPPTQLEKAMTAYYEGQYDVLLSTSIIESGLDIPRANTMILHRADMFGLAQLYQLRGRIGRSKLRAYAYLTVPPDQVLTPTAEKRLQVMQTLDTLGAGFTLASHDLDIRGAGNLLGEEQSGHIREVGIELYQQMLEEAVQEARGRAARETEWAPQINIGSAVLIPEAYVADLGIRLGLYRRIATLLDQTAIDAFAAELVDRFGKLPPEVENLLQIMAIKRLCRAAGVEKVDAGPRGAVIAFRGNAFKRPERLIDYITRNHRLISVRPDQRLVYHQNWNDASRRLPGVRKLLENVAALAA